MTHKKEYIKDGNKTSEYNKKYYQDNRTKILSRANKRLVDNPDINKKYYDDHKEHIKETKRKRYGEKGGH